MDIFRVSQIGDLVMFVEWMNIFILFNFSYMNKFKALFNQILNNETSHGMLLNSIKISIFFAPHACEKIRKFIIIN
jgi:hypothetical protein